MKRQPRVSRQSQDDSFEIEPLLVGKLVACSEEATTFRCRISELSAILEDRRYEMLMTALLSIKHGRGRRPRGDQPIVLYLLSPKLPVIRQQRVGIFHQASIITASTSLADADPHSEAVVTIVSGVADPNTLYQIANPPSVRFNTDLPKLKLKVVKTEIRIASEPFVIDEEWGYSPVIEVEVPSGDRYYIALNRSLRDIFENGRRKKDLAVAPTIVGNVYRVWKKSDNPQSGFDGFEIENFSTTNRAQNTISSNPKRESTASRSLINERRGNDSRTSRGRDRRSSATFCERCQTNIPNYFIRCRKDGPSASNCPIFFS